MRTKAWIAILIFSLTFIFLGNYFGERHGLLFSFLIMLCVNSFLYFYNESPEIYQVPFRVLEGQDSWGVIELVKKIAHKACILQPKIHLLETETALALSLGRSSNKSIIALSLGLLNTLNSEELEAVIAHEIAKIQKGDTFIFGILGLIGLKLYQFSQVLDRAFPHNWFIKNSLNGPFTFLFLFLTQMINRMILRKKYYFETDQLALRYIQNPKNLAKALWKLDTLAQTQLHPIPLTASHLFIVNSLQKYGFYKIFNYHPPVRERIQKIVGFFPL